VSASRASHLQLNEVSDGACFFRFPSSVALRTSNGAEFISIASAEVGTYFKKNKQHRYNENTEEAEKEKG